MDFRPIKNAYPRRYPVKASEVIAVGDPVCLDASAKTVVKWGNTETKDALGVAASATASGGASAGDYIDVYDDPDCVFIATADADVAQTNVGVACDVIGTSGDNFKVDIGTTTTAQFLVMRMLTTDKPLDTSDWQWGSARRVVGKFVKHVHANY